MANEGGIEVKGRTPYDARPGFVSVLSGGLRTATLGRGIDEVAADRTEDGADAPGHTRHDRACRHRNESRHQGVLDKVLAFRLFPDAKFQEHSCHCY